MKLRNIFGQPSWRLASNRVEAFVTHQGGHLGPVKFSLPGGKIQPYAIAPWAKERLAVDVPDILKVLRGDFFCCPFGGNAEPWRREKHLPHGESANAIWSLDQEQHDDGNHIFRFSLNTKTRSGLIEKKIQLRDGHNAVYCQHTLSGMSGPMSFGHHAMLRFPSKPGSGIFRTSRFIFGKVCDQFDSPALATPTFLQPGAEFKRLDRVPAVTGELTDISRYPARHGYEDAVLLVSDPKLPYAWTAVTFPEQRYVWFALKNPALLRFTLLWYSNGGRHFPPWNGRHVGVMALEEITSFFHYGLAESVASNSLSHRGYPTTVTLSKRHPTVIPYIMAVQSIPRGFDGVRKITLRGGQAILRSESGKEVTAPLDPTILQTAKRLKRSP